MKGGKIFGEISVVTPFQETSVKKKISSAFPHCGSSPDSSTATSTSKQGGVQQEHEVLDPIVLPACIQSQSSLNSGAENTEQLNTEQLSAGSVPDFQGFVYVLFISQQEMGL